MGIRLNASTHNSPSSPFSLATSVPDYVQFPITFQEKKPLSMLSLFFFLPGTTGGKIGYQTGFWTQLSGNHAHKCKSAEWVCDCMPNLEIRFKITVWVTDYANVFNQ